MSGLRPRPGVPEDVAQAVRQAVERVLASSRPPSRPTASPWRFSGRWFSAHPVRMRRRPT